MYDIDHKDLVVEVPAAEGKVSELYNSTQMQRQCHLCKFGKRRNKDEKVVKLDGREIPKSECFDMLNL